MTTGPINYDSAGNQEKLQQLRDVLAARSRTMKELIQMTGLGRRRVEALLRYLRSNAKHAEPHPREVRITTWRRNLQYLVPLYGLGSKPDAKRPPKSPSGKKQTFSEPSSYLKLKAIRAALAKRPHSCTELAHNDAKVFAVKRRINDYIRFMLGNNPKAPHPREIHISGWSENGQVPYYSLGNLPDVPYVKPAHLKTTLEKDRARYRAVTKDMERLDNRRIKARHRRDVRAGLIGKPQPELAALFGMTS